MKIDRRGIILNDNINLEWLKNLEPQYFDDFIKFVINPKTNKVCIGMSVHACCMPEMGPTNDLLGGNLFFEDGSVVCESTLNITKGTKHDPNNPRIITDENTTQLIKNVLFAWVKVD